MHCFFEGSRSQVGPIEVVVALAPLLSVFVEFLLIFSKGCLFDLEFVTSLFRLSEVLHSD